MNEVNNPNKKRILIIDDNTQIHQDFKKVLLISKENENDLDLLEEALLGKTSSQHDETYLIDCASQGEEGLKLVKESISKKEPYAVAFVDVRMPPGWDGIETISKIWEIYPDIQVVICTAYSDYSWDELFNKFGNTDKLLILKKPFDNIEVRQLTYTLSKKWELNRIANLKLNELERNVEERTKELQQSEEKYRTMIENSNDMIWTLDTKGNFLYYNQKFEELTNYKFEENTEISFVPIILKEDLKMVQNVFLDTLSGNPNHYEVRIYEANTKNIIILSVNTAPILKKGEVVGTVSFGRDITESKQSEEEIKINRERLHVLSKILRHDLTNDFAVIKSALRLYRINSETKMLDEIDKRVNKGLNTIHRQRKQESFIKAHSDLDEYKIEDVVNKTAKSYSDLEINVSGSGIVFADESIYSVFENLISNAIKHGNSTMLNIEINSKEDDCEIKFVDNGMGIPDKIKKKIFDEGFSYGKTGNTGIGLFIVKQIIEEYGGTVSVKDNKPNGAVFVISLKKVIKS